MLVRAAPVLLLLATACRAPEAPTPAPSPSAEELEAPAAPASEDPKSPAPVVAAETSPTDAILEAILTDDRFAMYLHPDVAGRVPVVVSGAARPEDVSLELHGAAVLTEPPESLTPEQAFVDITGWSVEDDRANVTLEYEIEGVAASFALQHEPSGRWVVTSADVAEH